jgi:hypothetical protein
MPMGSDVIARADRCGDRLAETALDSVLLAEGPLQIGPHAGDTKFGLCRSTIVRYRTLTEKRDGRVTSLAAHAVPRACPTAHLFRRVRVD